MVASEHPEMIEGRHSLISVDVLDCEEADEDGSIDNYGSGLDEEDESGSGEVDVRTGVTQSKTEEVEEVQRYMKYSYISSYILKPPSLLTQVFNKNNKSQKNNFKNMFNFGARAEWRNGRRDVRSYLSVEIRNDQCRLVNPTPLDCIAGYIMEDYIGDGVFKRLHQRRLYIIDGCISSYCYILNSPEWPHMIKQANELKSVIYDIESDNIG